MVYQLMITLHKHMAQIRGTAITDLGCLITYLILLSLRFGRWRSWVEKR